MNTLMTIVTGFLYGFGAFFGWKVAAFISALL